MGDVEEYLVQVARVNRADPVATGRRGGVPLSSGEIERLRREDFEKRRKLRLIQVREQAKTIAIARRQNFIEDIDRKRAQEKERRRKAWEAQQREKIQRCTQEYKHSLAAIGNAHLEAQQHATRTQAEKARKKALHARARIKEDARHKAALLTQRQEKAHQTFFVHKAQEEHRRLVRENISDEHRAKARRNAHAIEKARQRALASQAAAEAAQAAASRRRDRVIDISATVPNVATRLQDFAATRFHASLTQHAPAHNLPLENRSHDARDAPGTSSDADFDNARTTPRDAFEAATVLNRDIQNRLASESYQRAEHEALAAQRGRKALHEVRAVREQQNLQDALDALRKEEISSNSRDVVQKIRNSWQKRAALDDHKRKLQQRIFEQNFVQAAPSPSPSATFANQTSTFARPQPEILHVIPETEQLNQDLLASSTSADDSRVESPNKLSQLPGKTTPPSPIGADEGERLAHHDLRPSKSTDAGGDAAAAAPAPAAFNQHAHDPFDTSAAADQSVSSIAIPTAPPQHSMTRSSGIQEDENSDSEEEIDEETRALLEASRKARKRGNQSVQAILKMGQSFLEGSATDYTSSTNGNRRSGRADTTTTDDDDDDNDVDKSAIKGRPFRQLEQSLTRFLLGDDSDVDQDEDDDLDADQNDRVSSVADYLTREHVGLNASFVSSTSSDRSWEPRRAPGERPGALNDLAISVLRDLEARPARNSLQASFSVASSEVSSLRQFPLSPSSRPSTAAGLGQSRGPLQDGDIDDLIVHDDAWRDSAALTDWIHQVETALHNQEEEHANLEPSSASNKGIFSSVKDHHSVQAAADASAPAHVSQEANVEDLIVEDDGWKDDERFASFTADLAQYFETSNTPVSQSRGTPRQVPPAQSVNQDDREVLATPEESVQRALKTAREELRAAAALRESPNEIIFGSLLDPSADINLGLSDFTAPQLEASPPLPATSSEDEKDESAGDIKDDSALAFHEELFGISVTEELDRKPSQSDVEEDPLLLQHHHKQSPASAGAGGSFAKKAKFEHSKSSSRTLSAGAGAESSLISVKVEDPESGSESESFHSDASSTIASKDRPKSKRYYPITSCLLYSVSSISMVIGNKLILSTFNFKYEMVLLLAQNLISLSLLRLARALGWYKFEDFELRKALRWFPLNFFFVGMLLTGFYSLQLLSVPMMTIFKNSTNIIVTLGDYLMYGQTVTPGIIACLVLMVAAAAFAAANDITVDRLGISWAICNCFVSAGYVLYMPKAMKGTDLSSFGKVYYNSSLSIPLVLLLDMVAFGDIAAFTSSSEIYGAYLTIPFLSVVLFSGCIGFAISLASFNCVRQTSPTTYSMVGSMNKIPLSILGVIVFKTPLTLKSSVFVTISLLSGILYASPQRMDAAQADRVLQDLKLAIQEIHKQNASQLSFEELYRNAYNLVLHRHGETLYRGIESEVTAYLKTLGETVARAPDDLLLVELVQQWRTHTTTMTMIRDILMYMDRTFVLQERKEPVYELGLRIFKEEVAWHKNVRGRVQHMLLTSIEAERHGELIDRDVIRAVLQMLVELGINSPTVYEDDFEAAFLAETQKFYRHEANEYMQINTCPDYVHKAEKRLEEERARAKTYLQPSTEAKLIRIVSEEMVAKHAEHLVSMPNSGCRAMLEQDKLDSLNSMYRLFDFMNCRDHIRKCLLEYTKEAGERLVEDQDSDKKPVEFVGELLDLQSKCDRIIKEAFKDDKDFQKAIKEAFEFFVNKNQRCAQYLSMYLDDLMRNKSRAQPSNEAELSLKVDKVVVIFRYLQDKDIFENFYKQQLAKRLLSGRSVSEDAESSIIRKFKSECGQIFTSKLEGMFKDMKLSKETMEKYRAACPRPANSTAPELNVTVLTAGYWPSEQVVPCELPPAIASVCEEFKTFYLNSHSGRRLSWQTNQGTADLKAILGPGRSPHEFNVSTYQMCVLMLFNQADSLSFHDIETKTQIPAAELKRHLISLAAPRYRILLKDSTRSGVDATTIFALNKDFSSKHYRVRVQLVSARQNLGTAKRGVPEQVEEDRKHLIEAAIVRIMKSRKRLEHAVLVAETTRQLSERFAPSPQDIKRRIESLLEREYLERDPDDHRSYRYLA
ncbi:Cullin-3A [Hondaea fermentalgiana]|uniref:Cullin-3A n=1 Tax=Hondaea fermentalgiana TaxID=2315210 RepID=A0A2R5G624_9STRA|nr:Cullin-3A [Hondaea fermentalgiana]|eukprot:GBG23893.1 Cullin-3A [Hondaea fermentalgiana]